MQDPVPLHLDFTWTLRPVPFLSFIMIQDNTAHAFLDHYMEPDGGVFQIFTDNGMGNLGAFSLVGSMGSTVSHGKVGR